MPLYPSARTLTLLLLSLIVASLSGCAIYDRPYARGYYSPIGIAYYDYWYYPGVQVYYDIHRHIYFYPSNGGWVEVRELPRSLRSRLGRHVPIQSRYARPYREHNEHRRYYPYDRPPQKKAPEQYRYEPRHEPGYQRPGDRRSPPQGPVKRPPADNKGYSYGKDKQSGKSNKDNQHRNNKDKSHGRGHDKGRYGDQGDYDD